MNKKTLYIALGVILVLLVGYVGIMSRGNNNLLPSNTATSTVDPLNATYTINGQSVTLVSGKSEIDAAPGSASKIITTIFGQPVSGDLDHNGTPDAALILTQDGGGSGTFYYVVAAINTASGTYGTNAILLGDRIAPQNLDITNGRIVANYADRKATDPMTAAPSVGVSKYMIYNGSVLKEVSSTQQ